MTRILVRHHGTIDEFIGDAILAIFGAPQARGDDAARAVACAVEMQLAMAEVNARNRAEGLPEVEMGIGLNTGDVAVGNIGSRTRAKYGVVGGAVNLAARIESYTTGGQVLISQSTLDEAGGAVVVGETMQVTPKGVKRPLSIHRVAGIRGRADLCLEAAPLPMMAPAVALDVRFTVLDGKDTGGAPSDGCVLMLSRRAAEIASTSAVPVHANLKLRLAARDGSAVVHDVYAKVTREAAKRGAFSVRFTSMPAEAEALIDATLIGPRA
jgi:adenylate cyclase